MKTETRTEKSRADRDNEALDAEITDADRAYWAEVERDEIEKAARTKG